MKKMKRFVALALSVVMVLAMSVMAFADDTTNSGTTTPTTYTITAPSGTAHHYQIYQIFTGDLHNGVLSNVKWGENGTGSTGTAVDDTIISALTGVNSASDKEKLAVIKTYANLNGTPLATITNGATYTAAAGYYLIKDEDNSLAGKEESYTLYIVKVVGDVTIEPKSDKPTFEKKIKDTNDTTGDTTGWQDSADYDIGDKIPFQLKGKVAANYADYEKYYFAFHDKEESGLTFDPATVKVYVDGTEITSGYEVYTATEDKKDTDCTFEVVFSNLKQITSVHAGSVITVEYKSELNTNAKLGEEGNVNSGSLEFSNNPNQEQTGTPETGKTPWDNVIAFTYKVVVNKIDGDSKAALAGAEFTLSKKLSDGTTKDIAVVKNTAGTEFTFSGLDDGDYILTETKTPDGYNTISPITFNVSANHKVTWTGEERKDILESLSGNKVTGEITFTSSKSEGSLTTNVENKKGSTLPSTGGIGTTIFYVVGGILMVGAAVLLITKRRAEN